MKDIEQLLTASDSPKPRRALRADFTTQITNYIANHPTQKMNRPKELFMKLLTKPAIAVAALVGTVVIGGSAYAAVNNWPAISAFFAGETPTSNGRIVKVDTENCVFPNAFLMTPDDKNPGIYYYKVKDGSALTNEQVVEIVKGGCQQEAQIAFEQTAVKTLENNPANKDRVRGHYVDSVVKAITPTSITLESTIPYNTELKTVTQTFSNIDPDVLVYDGAQKLTLGDIHVGDHVAIKYRATGEALGEVPLHSINTHEQAVVWISKNKSSMSAAIDFAKYNGTEFEQVIPCDHGGHDGFCDIAQYYQNKQ